MPPKTIVSPRAVIPIASLKGRGAVSNRESRFDAWGREQDGDYVDTSAAYDEPRAVETQVVLQQARTIISRNNSPDVPFDQSINPYQGCEHGCIYCYARPSHAYLGLSPGLDFETKLFAKTNAAQLLASELSHPGYQPKLIALGANTDPYQPLEKKLGITRAVLQVLSDFNHPVGITTKSALVERDLDILAPMAAKGLVRVFMSVGTLDHSVARHLEPRASAPRRRIAAIARLAAAGVPAGVIVAPIIPALNDSDMEAIIEAAANAGASSAHYVLLRLPLEIRDLFVEWLDAHFPLRTKHVMSLVNQMRDGRDNDPHFGSRMRGTGVFAELLTTRFDAARKRHNLTVRNPGMDASLFAVPYDGKGQQNLF